MGYFCDLIFLCLVAPLSLGHAAADVEHPRLYFSKKDLGHLRGKKLKPFFAGVLQQYEDALEHKLNYSSGGILVDVENGPGTRLQLATTLYLLQYGNNYSFWGDLAKKDLYKKVTALTPASGNWFAGSERNLEQYIASYDVLAALFSPEEARVMEESFSLNANYMYSSLGVSPDMASRLMNPSADRLAAVGLIALTFPNQPNATKWLDQSLFEFKWMLQNGVMEDGQWHEPTTRYHGRVLAAFIPFAYALRQAGVMDPFAEIKNFKKYVGWYRHVLTPPDSTFGGCALTPALSDGNWELVWSVTLGWSAAAYVQTDPTYAAQLWEAWERACAPMGLEPSPPAQLTSLLFIGCVHEGECTDRFMAPFSSLSRNAPISSPRQSTLLTGYAVLEQPALESHPYFIMSTSTQRQTEGHEHPDRGSFSLYSHETPIVLDPGVGWCGYNWFGTIPANRANGTAFDKGLQFGAWYRGSQSHSMVNFAKEGPDILPENKTWRPAGAYGHEWGLRGAAWVQSNLFSDALDYVDLNITRAVQASQLGAVQGYHRRVFANRRDGSYLLWDAIDAPLNNCSQATYNLHVVTQLKWPGVVGCQPVSDARFGATNLECTGLSGLLFDVTVLQPSNAVKDNLLHLEADPLPIQFTGMTGSAGHAPGMSSVGGALGGDWNAPGNLPPKDPYWAPRTPTWIRINGGKASCNGFLTLLHAHKPAEDKVAVESFEVLPGGSFRLTVVGETDGRTLYLLGQQEQMNGVSGVVGWGTDGPKQLDHAELVEGTWLSAPKSSFRISTSFKVSLSLTSPSHEQYILRVNGPASDPVVVNLTVPWTSPPQQVNVWRGAHVWHVMNNTLNSGSIEPALVFEVLPGLDYLIERQCVRSQKAGYHDGKGGWLCNIDEENNEL